MKAEALTSLAARRHTLRGPLREDIPFPMESRWNHIGGIRFHSRYCAGPQARDHIVLVHGLGVSSLYMMPLAQELASRFQVHVPDLPGFGYTPGPWRGITISEMAGALASWLEELNLDAPLLFGNSLGCQFIARLASQRPDLTRGLVLQGPTFDDANPFTQILRWLRDSPREPSSQTLVLLHDYLRCGLRRLVGTFRHALSEPMEALLTALDLPVLVIRGSRDPIITESWAHRVVDLLPQGALREVPGGAHTLNYSAPLELKRIMDPFLDALYPS